MEALAVPEAAPAPPGGVVCQRCHGRGRVLRYDLGQRATVAVKCWTCKGAGPPARKPRLRAPGRTDAFERTSMDPGRCVDPSVYEAAEQRPRLEARATHPAGAAPRCPRCSAAKAYGRCWRCGA